MPRIEAEADISASPETVWTFLADPSYAPRLSANVISVEADPPGLSTVGQKLHFTAKVARRKVEALGEVAEVEANRKLVIRQRPGGLFKSFTATQLIEPTKKGTHATFTFDYEPSMGYLGKILTPILVNRALRRDVNTTVRNLKEIAELKEMPKTG